MMARIVVEEVDLPDGRKLRRGDVVDSDKYPALLAAGIAEKEGEPMRTPIETMKRK